MFLPGIKLTEYIQDLKSKLGSQVSEKAALVKENILFSSHLKKVNFLMYILSGNEYSSVSKVWFFLICLL